MNTIRMTSKMVHSYGQKTYNVGDTFEAEEVHVKMLTATGRAEVTPQTPPQHKPVQTTQRPVRNSK